MTEGVVDRLGWTLIHFVWQGCAGAAVLAALRHAVPERAARVRYAAGCAVLLGMLAAPIATFALLGQSAEAPSIAAAPAVVDVAGDPGVAPAAVASAPESAWLPVARERLEAAFPGLLVLWLTGVLLLSARLARGWRSARRLAGSGETAPAAWQASLARLREALGLERPVRLMLSAATAVPSVVGWLRPVVVLPAAVATGMTSWQVEAVLAHELAHIRRHDYLVNLLQAVVETVLFYHPAVWWVSRQLREERERCCDDVAVALCGDAGGYVRALAEIEAARPAPAPALAATGGSLLGRARRLLAPADARRSSASVAGAVLLGLLACVWATARAESSHDAAPRLVAPGATAPIPAAAAGGDEEPVIMPAMPPVPETPGTPTVADDEAPIAAAPPMPIGPETPAISAAAAPVPVVPSAPSVHPAEAPVSVVPSAPSVRSAEAPVPAAPSAPLVFPASPPVPVAPSAPSPIAVPALPARPERPVPVPLSQEDAPDAFELPALPGRPVESGPLRAGPPAPPAPPAPRAAPPAPLAAPPGPPIPAPPAPPVAPARPDLIDDMAALGYRGVPVDKLVALRIHGVSRDYVREMNAVGLGRLSVDVLVTMKIHGVTPAYARELRAERVPIATPAELVTMKIHGVTGAYARGLRAQGVPIATPDELVSMKIHGVTPDFARRASRLVGGRVTPARLVQLRIVGVVPK